MSQLEEEIALMFNERPQVENTPPTPPSFERPHPDIRHEEPEDEEPVVYREAGKAPEANRPVTEPQEEPEEEPVVHRDAEKAPEANRPSSGGGSLLGDFNIGDLEKHIRDTVADVQRQIHEEQAAARNAVDPSLVPPEPILDEASSKLYDSTLRSIPESYRTEEVKESALEISTSAFPVQARKAILDELTVRTQTQEQVDNAMARYRYAVYSSLAYSTTTDEAEEELKHYLPNSRMDTEIYSDRIKVFSSTTRTNAPIVLSVRGTGEIEDGLTDTLMASGLPVSMTPRYKEAQRALEAIRLKYPGRPVVYTGHSLGGTIAAELARVEGGRAVVYNMGASPVSQMRWQPSRAEHIDHYHAFGDPFSMSATLNNQNTTHHIIYPSEISSYLASTFNHGMANFLPIGTIEQQFSARGYTIDLENNTIASQYGVSLPIAKPVLQQYANVEKGSCVYDPTHGDYKCADGHRPLRKRRRSN